MSFVLEPYVPNLEFDSPEQPLHLRVYFVHVL
jgi:hypothetical protein